MPLQREKYEIELRGLQQHSDDRKTLPGTLSRADNVEIVKEGTLTIRRGYRRIHTAQAVDGVGVRGVGRQLFHKLVVWRGTVVVLAHTRIYAVVSRTNAIAVSGGTTGISDHGRLGRCNVRSRVVATAERSTGDGGVAGEP
jgi:hypothetical protein